MQEILSVIILAIVQGLTEWLPISSSGHLVLFTNILQFNGGLAFDVALHLGTLISVIVYFWKDLISILKSLIKLDFASESGKLIPLLIVASIPSVIVGFFFYDYFNSIFNDVFFLGVGFIINALILTVASLDIKINRKNPNYMDSLFMGIGQAISIFPSISRSGATVAFGFLRGVKEQSIARFSFLMSIPVIFGANILVGVKDLGTAQLELNFNLFLGIVISFIVGLMTIHYLMKYVFKNRKNLRWFALYSLILGILVLWLI